MMLQFRKKGEFRVKDCVRGSLFGAQNLQIALSAEQGVQRLSHNNESKKDRNTEGEQNDQVPQCLRCYVVVSI
jgi:hypothetical protein